MKRLDTLVIGGGITGASVRDLLEPEGQRVTIFDDRPERGDLHDLADLARMVHSDMQMVKSPGVPWSHPAVRLAEEKGVPLLTELDLFFDRAVARSTPIIAVTGTNGKSTVVDALRFVLEKMGHRVFMGGNIGRPMLTLFASAEVDIIVLEVSSFQLERVVRFAPTVGILLNIAPNHLDRYPSVEAYAETKRILIERSDLAIVGSTVEEYLSLDGILPLIRLGQDLFFSSDGTVLHTPTQTKSVYRSALDPTIGSGENLLAVVAVLEFLSVDLSAALAHLGSYPRLPYRMQLLAPIRGRRVINDSKSTTLHATRHALHQVRIGGSPAVHLLMGGRPKESGHREFFSEELDPLLSIYLFGELGARLSEEPPVQNAIVCSTMSDALRAALERSSEGETILFSPGCASFDQFKNYEDRGSRFNEEVDRLRAA